MNPEPAEQPADTPIGVPPTSVAISSPVPVPTMSTPPAAPAPEPTPPATSAKLYEPSTFGVLFRDLDDAKAFRNDPWFRDENHFQSLVAPVIAASSDESQPVCVMFELVTTLADVDQANNVVQALATAYRGWLDGDPEPAPAPEPAPEPVTTEAVTRANRW